MAAPTRGLQLVVGPVIADAVWAHQLSAPLASPETRERTVAHHVVVDRVRTAWLEVPLRPRRGHPSRWTVAFRLAAQDGAVVVAELRLFPAERETQRPEGEWSGSVLGHRARVPRGGLKALDVREGVQFGAHYQAAGEVLRALTEPQALVILRGEAETQGFRRSVPSGAGAGRGRPRRPDLYFARMAAAYVTAIAQGSQQPRRAAARALKLTPAAVRDGLHEARARALLTRTTPGRPGGELTQKARAILGERQKEVIGRSTRAARKGKKQEPTRRKGR